MAIEDIYKKLRYVSIVNIPDGTGGFEKAYKIGEEFEGSAVKSPSSEQQVAGIRGVLGEQYNITTSKKNKLSKDSVVLLLDEEGNAVFLRINDTPLYTPKHSTQSDWKGLTATRFEPDYRVVE